MKPENIHSKEVHVFHFPFKRDSKNPPIATLTVYRDKEFFYAGLSVCSEKDQFSKKTGRTIAFHRMMGKPIVGKDVQDLLTKIGIDLGRIFANRDRLDIFQKIWDDVYALRHDLNEMEPI